MGAAHAVETDDAEAQGQILNADLLDGDLADAAWSKAGYPSAPEEQYDQLNVELIDDAIQVDLGDGVQLPLINNDGSGLLELGQLGALHSYAWAPSETRAVAAAGAVADDGTIALDTVGGEDAATLNLIPVFEQLNLDGLTDQILDEAALELGAVASNMEREQGTTESTYKVADAELVLSSPLVSDLTGALGGVVTQLGSTLDQVVGDESATSQIISSLESLNVLGVGVDTAQVEVSGLDEALDELNQNVLQGTVTTENGLADINLDTGEITVNLENLVEGGLNGHEDPIQVLDSETIAAVVDDISATLSGLVTELRDELTPTLDAIQLDVALEVDALGLVTGGISVEGSLASFLELVDEEPDVTDNLNIIGLELEGLLSELVDGVLGVVGSAVGDVVNPVLETLLDDLDDLLSAVTNDLDPVLRALSQVLGVTINEQGETQLSGHQADYVTALSLTLLPELGNDDAGKISLATSSVRALDEAQAEPVEIVSPEDGATVIGDEVAVTGTAEPGAELTVTLGEATEPATADAQTGEWSVEFTGVEPGETTVTATDGETEDSVTFTVEAAEEPIADVVITSPEDDATVTGSDVLVAGTAEPGAELTVTLGELTEPATADAQTGEWSVEFTGVEPGETTVTATDGETEDSVTFTVEAAEEPIADVVITSPEDDATVTGSDVLVAGTAEPGAELTVTLGELTEPATADAQTGEWSVEFTGVEPGETTVTATDGETEDSVTFTVEAAEEPIVSVDPDTAAPGDEVTVDGENFAPGSTVTVVVTDEDGNEIGEPIEGVEVDDEGNFSTPWPIPADVDPGQLAIEASDEDGNSGSTELTVAYDPALSVDPDEAEVGQEVEITGSGYAPNSEIDLEVNPSIEGVTSDDAGNFTVPWTVSDELDLGDHIITGTDELDNTAETTLTVIDGTAGGDDDADDEPSLNVDPDDVVPGDDVTIGGDNFDPEESVTIEITDEDGNVVDTITVETGADGSFEVTWTVPEDIGLGVLTLTASDEAGNSASVELTVSAAGTGAGGTDGAGDDSATGGFGSGDGLASTGAMATLIATAVALLLIALGVAMLIARHQNKVKELN
jgi:hypothetical protein